MQVYTHLGGEQWDTVVYTPRSNTNHHYTMQPTPGLSMPPIPDTTTIRTQHRPSLGLSRRSSLCVAYLPHSTARVAQNPSLAAPTLAPPVATPESLLSDGSCTVLPDEEQALAGQENHRAVSFNVVDSSGDVVESGGDVVESSGDVVEGRGDVVEAVLSPLRQLNLNVPSETADLSHFHKEEVQKKDRVKREGLEEDGALSPLHRLLQLCGQPVCVWLELHVCIYCQKRPTPPTTPPYINPRMMCPSSQAWRPCYKNTQHCLAYGK